MKIKITFTEELLGTKPLDAQIFERFVNSKAPNGSQADETAAAAAAAEEDESEQEKAEKVGTCIFHRQDDSPGLWDYQIKGFFKDDPRGAWLYDAKGGFVGFAPARHGAAHPGDAAALTEHYRAKTRQFAPIMAEARKLAAPITAAAAAKQDHNAALFAAQAKEQNDLKAAAYESLQKASQL